MSYVNSLYHVILRTKYSKPTITEKYERDLYSYIYGFIQRKGCILYRINGMPDHIHIFLDLSPKICISEFVHDLKISTNNFLRSHRHEFPMFESWESEYFATTKSQADKGTVINYIMQQKEHHKSVSFREELRKFCMEEGIDVNLKYI